MRGMLGRLVTNLRHALAAARTRSQAGRFDVETLRMQAILDLAAQEIGEMRVRKINEQLGLDIFDRRASDLLHPAIEMIKAYGGLTRARSQREEAMQVVADLFERKIRLARFPQIGESPGDEIQSGR